MSHLIELRLFGHPEVRLHGQPLAPALPHKALALLYHVALAEQPVGRETLATLLWPDAPVQTAKHSLRNLLSLLRKALGDELEITQRTIGLSVTDPRQIDVLAFEQGLATLQKAQQQAEAPDLAQWQTTLDLYRGDFLEGFYIHQSELFEEWTALHREYLRSQLITNLLALSEAYAANAAPEAALACLDRLLTIDPENEAAHTQHIQLLLRLGRRTEALQRFERYRQLLAAEFGISPSPELTTLLAEVRTPADDKPILAQWRQAVTATPISVASAPVRVSTVPSASPPAPPTTQGIPNNLISPLSAFIGRDQELAFLAQRLADPACSLLTIVGPGGMGKTSLALALGQRLLRTAPNGRPADFPDGIFWVPLLDVGAASHEDNAPALADDPATGEAILRAIAEQIECPLAAGVSSMTQLQAYLRERRLLLIVDNFEHLLAGTQAVVTLLGKAAQVKMVITSRARLNVRGETVLTLDKLSLPAASYYAASEAAPASAIQPDSWQTSEAVSMFVQRAQQSDPAFTIDAATIGPVGQICRLVEGLPLGIELATSMLPLLNCATLAKDLAQSLDVLAADTRDLPRDQRTLRAVFERSWRLLTPDAQRLLARLSIFPGSFRREAAEYIVGASIAQLQQLVNQSLVSKAGEERFTLHRIVHAFAQEKFQQWPEQHATLQLQYAQYYLDFLARLEPDLTQELYATITEQIQTDLDNVRTAWRWSVEQGNLALLELSVGSLQDFYRLAGIYPEAIQLLESALPTVRQAVALGPAAAGYGIATSRTGAQRLLARLLCYTAQFYRLYRRSGEVEKGEIWANEALELGNRLADPALQALAYHELARLAQTRVDFAAMCRLSEQACTYARQANLPLLTAESLNDLGIATGVYIQPLAAPQHFHAALECLRQRPNLALEARIFSNLGLFHLVGHAYQAAYRYLQLRRSLQRLLQDQDNSLLTLINLGDLWVALGVYSVAQEEYQQGLTLVQARHGAYWESWLHVGYGRLQRLLGDLAAAQITCRLALQIAQKDRGPTEIQWALIELGHVLANLGDFAAATDCYQQAIALPKETNWFFRTPDAHAGLAALALTQNKITAALTNTEAALALLAEQGLAAAGEPFAVYWTCVRVLQAAGDPRADTVLATAYHQLQEIANQLETEGLRRSFLENVAVNCNLVAAALAAGVVSAEHETMRSEP